MSVPILMVIREKNSLQNILGVIADRVIKEQIRSTFDMVGGNYAKKLTEKPYQSCSVKLNDDYEGATLYWPRQDVSNADIPIGKMILFPGMVTHGHYVSPLTSGTKYSATFWTARYKGDYL